MEHFLHSKWIIYVLEKNLKSLVSAKEILIEATFESYFLRNSSQRCSKSLMSFYLFYLITEIRVFVRTVFRRVIRRCRSFGSLKRNELNESTRTTTERIRRNKSQDRICHPLGFGFILLLCFSFKTTCWNILTPSLPFCVHTYF
jgi:hypothetical protein